MNYFAHTGHLHIRGLKMSKSLKNFITIRQALEGVDGLEGVRPSTMRIMFCLVQYNAPCDYSDNMCGAASSLHHAVGVAVGESALLVNLTWSRRWRR